MECALLESVVKQLLSVFSFSPLFSKLPSARSTSITVLNPYNNNCWRWTCPVIMNQVEIFSMASSVSPVVPLLCMYVLLK